MKTVRLLALGSVAGLAGCHSAYVEATVRNDTGQPISLVEVDYPSASFGTQTLAPGATFPYRFKVLGEGPTRLLWTDHAHADHHADGPELHEGDEGRLLITLNPTGVAWQPSFKPH